MQQELTGPQTAYINAEYGKLNNELESILKEIRSREKYSLTIVAAVAVWLFENYSGTDHYILLAASFIPVITTLIYGISVLALSTNISWIREYLTCIENQFLEEPNKFGWERFFKKKNKVKFYSKTSFVMWILQLSLAIGLVIVACNSKSWKSKFEIKKTDKKSYLQMKSIPPLPLAFRLPMSYSE